MSCCQRKNVGLSWRTSSGDEDPAEDKCIQHMRTESGFLVCCSQYAIEQSTCLEMLSVVPREAGIQSGYDFAKVEVHYESHTERKVSPGMVADSCGKHKRVTEQRAPFIHRLTTKVHPISVAGMKDSSRERNCGKHTLDKFWIFHVDKNLLCKTILGGSVF